MSFFISKSQIIDEISAYYKSNALIKQNVGQESVITEVYKEYPKGGVSLPLGLWSDIFTDFPNMKGEKRPHMSSKKTPLERQAPVCKKALSLLKEKHCFFGNLATAFGKTSIANILIGRLKKKALIICGLRTVLDQWEEEFKEHSNYKVQRLTSTKKFDNDADIYICTPHQIEKRKHTLIDIPIIVFDEMHKNTVSTFQTFLSLRPEYLIGLTATKERGDYYHKAIDLFFGKDTTITIKPNKSQSVLYKVETHVEPSTVKYIFAKGKKNTDVQSMITLLSTNEEKNNKIVETLGGVLIEEKLEEYTRLLKGKFREIKKVPQKVKEELPFSVTDGLDVYLPWSEYWTPFLGEELKKEISMIDYQIKNQSIRDKTTIYPPEHLIFRVFGLCKPEDIRVLILGMDPYINEGEAMGVAFSVPEETKKMPPSLRNIFKELESDLGIKRTNKDLTDWVKQGIFLLNTSLTVEKGKSGSHIKLWRSTMDKILEKISKLENLKVVVLWGNDARKYSKVFSKKKVIESAHPSPLSASRGFFGSKPFSKILKELREEIVF